MRQFLKIAIPVFILGFVAGNAFWYLFSPLWIDRVVSEGLPPELMTSRVASGQFHDADAAHRGKGMAQILRTAGGAHLLRLSDFEVTNGPDLEMWLVKEADPKSSADVKASQWVSLGALKGNIGDQNYVIPDDVDVSAYGSAVVWCRQFGVLFSSAPLSPAQ
ncbi:hypothetical protein CSC94_05335 [Zhengella mangrovi]|uniref:DM13 domain-containing protein n=1 Tax=Zhengella mangrovi TaxID=1982044 RepID=A0A2G1QRF0_9HYPH|nr:DM13 domain-containing protein [Zhengella mangrovi]PHP68085.1 hypothetical protein CSC94_05335 [Zhengella mangrovi]